MYFILILISGWQPYGEVHKAVTGDINHSKRFVSEFRSTCAATLQRKLKQYLSTPLECTGRRPPIAFSCVKMAEKRRSGQMTAIATIFPDPKGSPDELMQTFFVGNPVVWDHTGKGLAQSVAFQLLKIVDGDSISSQPGVWGYGWSIF